jgi:hypothetical protein
MMHNQIISLYITLLMIVSKVWMCAEAVYHGMKQYLKPVKFNK